MVTDTEPNPPSARRGVSYVGDHLDPNGCCRCLCHQCYAPTESDGQGCCVCKQCTGHRRDTSVDAHLVVEEIQPPAMDADEFARWLLRTEPDYTPVPVADSDAWIRWTASGGTTPRSIIERVGRRHQEQRRAQWRSAVQDASVSWSIKRAPRH